MSNTKNLADLLKVCSILPALVIMPAMAETEIIEERVKLDADKVYQTDVLAKDLNGANGAVFEVASGVSLVFKDDAVFQNNTSTSFGGAIKMVVGFDTEGTVTGVKVLEHAETPGLGDLISKPGSKVELSIVGRNPGKIKMAVTKDGGDVDALTAATITSRAYVGAVDKAFNAYLTKTRGAAADGYSGATALETPAEEQKGGNNE